MIDEKVTCEVVNTLYFDMSISGECKCILLMRMKKIIFNIIVKQYS